MDERWKSQFAVTITVAMVRNPDGPKAFLPLSSLAFTGSHRRVTGGTRVGTSPLAFLSASLLQGALRSSPFNVHVPGPKD